MASLRDGCGDGYFILFSPAGAIMKSLALDCAVWQAHNDRDQPIPGLFDVVPTDFSDFLIQPAFSIPDSTFCLWRCRTDNAWQVGQVAGDEGGDPDGSAGLLHLLDGNPEAYRAWAEDYFEVAIDPQPVAQIIDYQPLTKRIVHSLNPDLTWDELAEDLAEIAYPVA